MDYLNEFLDAGYGYGKANQVRNAVTKLLIVNGHENVLACDQFKAFLKSFKKLTLSRRKQRSPIRSSNLNFLVSVVMKSQLAPGIKDQLRLMYEIGYWALARIGEVLPLTRGGPTSVTVPAPGKLEINWEKTKTSPLPVKRTFDIPVEMGVRLEKLISRTPQGKRIFASITRSSANTVITKVFPPHQGFYSFHSLRHGRARDLWATQPQVQVMWAGRWASMGSLRIYLGMA